MKSSDIGAWSLSSVLPREVDLASAGPRVNAP